jgi:putative redox protein
MVNVSIKYTGDLHCDAVHGPSHAKIATDAPTDNKGKGESFLRPISSPPRWEPA